MSSHRIKLSIGGPISPECPVDVLNSGCQWAVGGMVAVTRSVKPRPGDRQPEAALQNKTVLPYEADLQHEVGLQHKTDLPCKAHLTHEANL